jgi:hypothetical protein
MAFAIAVGFGVQNSTWLSLGLADVGWVSAFEHWPHTDVSVHAEIAALIGKCFRRGGIDLQAVASWEARFRAESKPKSVPTLAPWDRQ